MSSSKLLKERIESIQDTMKITNAMYLISSSKLRKARQNYQNVLPYFTRMRDTISRVVPHLPDEPEHPFFHERDLENPKRAYIVLTADKGMAGAYNQNLLKFLREHADQNDRFYVIGQVGYRALLHKDPRLVEDFHYGATAPTLQRARDITVDAIDDFKSGKLTELEIYNCRCLRIIKSILFYKGEFCLRFSALCMSYCVDYFIDNIYCLCKTFQNMCALDRFFEVKPCAPGYYFFLEVNILLKNFLKSKDFRLPVNNCEIDYTERGLQLRILK